MNIEAIFLDTFLEKMILSLIHLKKYFMDDRWFTIVKFVCFCLTYEVPMSLGG